MKTIIIASSNPVKARAALNGFRRMFPAEPFEILPRPAPSGVSDQPMTSAETLLGALNRAAAARAAHPGADFWVGIEGGVEEDGVEESGAAGAVGGGVSATIRIGPGRRGS